jgi:8-oxo-dGTP diphosphatase
MTVTDVVAGVIKIDSSYLICRRPAYKRHGGLWEFPGGKVNQGEPFADAISRELMEELGLLTTEISEALYFHQDPGTSFVIHFVPVVVSGSVVLNEHTEARWCSISELMELPLAPTDRKFVEFLGD